MSLGSNEPGAPLAIDLFCGLGGWTEGLLAEGYHVIGFDIERHVYGDKHYPAQLIIQDVLSLHGSQFKSADLIVASPPCQEFSYMAMPWQRAKQIRRALKGNGEFPEGYTGSRTVAELTALFDACFRLQREACQTAGRHIPLIVENVRGANEWVGRSRWNFGSFHLWGDVPALMPPIFRGSARLKTHAGEQWNVNRTNYTGTQGWDGDGTKNTGGSWFNIGSPGQKTLNKNPVHELAGLKWGDCTGKRFDQRPKSNIAHREGTKQRGTGAEWFDTGIAALPSGSPRRKAASAMIAKIPLPLSRHIAATFYPRMAA